MFDPRFQRAMCALTLAGAMGCGIATVRADDRDDGHHVKKVFVIAMENHNWTQPSSQTSPGQIFGNPAAPFLNSLVNGTSGISSQVAYASAYLNAAVGDHPSEPNYIWAEAGTNFGVNNDADPYQMPSCIPNNSQLFMGQPHLTGYLTIARKSWKSYQEDTDVDATNTPLPASSWTVPLVSHSGTWTAPGTNAYNYSNQFNYAAKHNPMVFFTDTNGGCNVTTSNPLRLNYAPLQQLALDLAHNTVADYNWITPDQYNDQHTALNAGFGQYPSTSDSSNVAQGDNFLARVVPLIMSSDAYQDDGVIILWWDESEGGDDPSRTMPFIVISKDAHKNVGGLPYTNTNQYSHSSFLRTMQEIFEVDPEHHFAFLGAALTASDLSDLFKPGAIR